MRRVHLLRGGRKTSKNNEKVPPGERNNNQYPSHRIKNGNGGGRELASLWNKKRKKEKDRRVSPALGIPTWEPPKSSKRGMGGGGNYGASVPA